MLYICDLLLWGRTSHLLYTSDATAILPGTCAVQLVSVICCFSNLDNQECTTKAAAMVHDSWEGLPRCMTCGKLLHRTRTKVLASHFS